MRRFVAPVADSGLGMFESMLAGLLPRDQTRAASMAAQAAADTVGKSDWILGKGRMGASSESSRQIGEMKDGH